MQYGNDVFKSEREELQNLKSGLGLDGHVPNGTPMYFYLCRAVKDIKEREKRLSLEYVGLDTSLDASLIWVRGNKRQTSFPVTRRS